MNRFLAIGAVALFSFMVAGTAMAQERAVLQDGFRGTGAVGGVDDNFIRGLAAKPETIYGRLWGKDMPGGKVYVETGGGALVTIRLNERANVESFKAIGVGNDVEVQAYRNIKRLGSGGAFAADVPDGDLYGLDVSVIREATNPSNLTPQAGFNPDTDRGILSKDSSLMGGVGGQCFQCYSPDTGAKADYK